MSDCGKCGEELYVIKGLCFDRDGIREARYCEGCGTVFSSHAHGLVQHKVLASKAKPDEALKKELGDIAREILAKGW